MLKKIYNKKRINFKNSLNLKFKNNKKSKMFQNKFKN